MPERLPLFLYGPVVTRTPTPGTDDRIREQKPASIIGAQLYNHCGAAVATLTTAPDWNIVLGDVLWPKAYAYDNLLGDLEGQVFAYSGEADRRRRHGLVKTVVPVHYPDCGDMFVTNAVAWLASHDYVPTLWAEAEEVVSGDWHSPSQR